MCAGGVADFSRNARPISTGTGGRNGPEWVADLKRNQWPNWAGIRNRAKLYWQNAAALGMEGE